MSNARNLARIYANASGEVSVSNVPSIPGTKISSALPYTIYPTGTVIQTLTANSGFTNQSINSGSAQPLSGMSITMTTKVANSKILIFGMVNASWTYVTQLQIYRNGSSIVPSHGGTSQTGGAQSLFTHYATAFGTSEDKIMPFPFQYYDTPGSIGTFTYAIYANSGWAGGTNVYYFNNRNSQDMLSSSYFTVMEIAP